MHKYRLIIAGEDEFRIITEHNSYEEAVKALLDPTQLSHERYTMRIFRTDTRKIVDHGWCNPPEWGWVYGGIEDFADQLGVEPSYEPEYPIV